MTNIISVSTKNNTTNSNSDLTKIEEVKSLKNRISLKDYYESIEIKKYNSLPILIFKKGEKQNSKISICFHDNIIEKFCRNFAINNLYVHSKLYNIKYNLCICTKVINVNNIVNNNINNEDKINNMSTNDSLSLSIAKTQKNYINFAFSKKIIVIIFQNLRI